MELIINLIDYNPFEICGLPDKYNNNNNILYNITKKYTAFISENYDYAEFQDEVDYMSAFKYFSKKLQNNKSVIETLVIEYGDISALNYISDELKCEKDFILNIAKIANDTHSIIQYIGFKIDDYNYLEKLLDIDNTCVYDIYKYLSPTLQKNTNILLQPENEI